MFGSNFVFKIVKLKVHTKLHVSGKNFKFWTGNTLFGHF